MDLPYNRIPRRTVYATLGILISLILLLALPVTVSRTVDITGKILPAREWMLVKNEEGGVLATLTDYRQRSVEEFAAINIIRGDAFQFTLRSSIRTGDRVSAGDTVASILSHELAREASRLSGELAVAKSNLAVRKTGEKEPIVEEAERGLALARERAEVAALVFARDDSLYRKNLISSEEFELSRGAARLAAIEVTVAEARLQTVRTGARPEDIQVIESQIQGLQDELRVLSEEVGALTLASPFSGVVLSSPGTDTLCIVEDTSRVVLMAIPVRYLSRVVPGQSVSVRAPGPATLFEGTVSSVDRRVQIVNGRQVVMAIATLFGATMELPSNLVVVGSIETDRVSLSRYIQCWITDIMSEVFGGTTGI